MKFHENYPPRNEELVAPLGQQNHNCGVEATSNTTVSQHNALVECVSFRRS